MPTSTSLFEDPYITPQAIAKSIALYVKIVRRLQIQPEAVGRAKEARGAARYPR